MSAAPGAVVTGGGTGIGRAVAAELVERGYRVALLGRREHVLREAAAAIDPEGAVTHVQTCDVSSPDSVRQAMSGAVDRFGGLGLLVNNAGVLTPATIERTTDEDWARMSTANLDGTFHGLREAMSLMRDRGGVVINVASMLGGVPVPGFGGYGATKAGIIHLTKVAALEGARHGIRVNAVMPGYVETPMSEEAQDDPELLARIIERIPARRFARPEEVARAVAFLASEDADYITGTTLLIDGGYSLRP